MQTENKQIHEQLLSASAEEGAEEEFKFRGSCVQSADYSTEIVSGHIYINRYGTNLHACVVLVFQAIVFIISKASNTSLRWRAENELLMLLETHLP